MGQRFTLLLAQELFKRRRELRADDVAVGILGHLFAIGDAAKADDVCASRARSNIGHSVADHGDCAVAESEVPAHNGLAIGACERRG